MPRRWPAARQVWVDRIWGAFEPATPASFPRGCRRPEETLRIASPSPSAGAPPGAETGTRMVALQNPRPRPAEWRPDGRGGSPGFRISLLPGLPAWATPRKGDPPRAVAFSGFVPGYSGGGRAGLKPATSALKSAPASDEEAVRITAPSVLSKRARHGGGLERNPGQAGSAETARTGRFIDSLRWAAPPSAPTRPTAPGSGSGSPAAAAPACLGLRRRSAPGCPASGPC